MKFRHFLAIVLLLLGAFSSQAHDPGLSSAKLVWQDGVLRATLTFAPIDVDALGDGKKLSAAQLNELAKGSLEIWFDGKAAQASDVSARTLENKDVEFTLAFPMAGASRLRARSALLDRLPFGHRQYFSLVGANGATIAEKLLSGDNAVVEAEINSDAATASAVSVSHPFTEFLVMGIKHILTGYDHLLFLFALLIGCKQVSSFIKVITAFTVAHSISLALATLGLVNFSSRIVEPLIAATIVYVAIENIVRRDKGMGHRVWLTFGFGLVHGFGFASALREMGVGEHGSAVAVPLLAFNSGVEIGQLMVAAVILPIIWSVKDKPQFVLRWAPACSVLVALAGSFWFVQRVFIN